MNFRPIQYGELCLQIPENVLLSTAEIMKSKIFRQISDVFSSYNVELADIFGHVTMQEIFIVFLVLERNDDNLLRSWAFGLN